MQNVPTHLAIAPVGAGSADRCEHLVPPERADNGLCDPDGFPDRLR